MICTAKEKIFKERGKDGFLAAMNKWSEARKEGVGCTNVQFFDSEKNTKL